MKPKTTLSWKKISHGLVAISCVAMLLPGQGLLLAQSATPAPATPAPAAPALPVTAAFVKVPNVEGPPYALTLVNTSTADLTVSGKVLLSVTAHNVEKARAIPASVIKPGSMYTIAKNLAAMDKVVLNAEGFAPLELMVK